MSVTLRLQRGDELAALLTAQQDPQSSQYHQWLTPREFDARFAPNPEEYNAVVGWLQRAGFTVHEKTNGARIDFSGTVADVERSFGVRMNHYAHRGRAPLANENPPLVPSEFINTVEFIRLNTFPLAEPRMSHAASPGIATAPSMAPADMYVAYNTRPLLDAGVIGSGQTNSAKRSATGLQFPFDGLIIPRSAASGDGRERAVRLHFPLHPARFLNVFGRLA